MPLTMQRARTLLEEIDLTPVDQKRRLTRTDVGDSLDIAAVYSGHHMTAWTRARRKRIPSPQQVTLVVDLSTWWGEPAEKMYWKGAAVVAASDMLELAGYMTQIVVGRGDRTSCSVSDQSIMRSTRITVKDYDQPLDASTAAAALIPGFARALIGAWDRMTPPFPVGWGSFPVGRVITDEGDFLVESSVRDKETAKQWLHKTMEKINQGDDA